MAVSSPKLFGSQQTRIKRFVLITVQETELGFHVDEANAPGAWPFCFEESGSLCGPESPDDSESLGLGQEGPV